MLLEQAAELERAPDRCKALDPFCAKRTHALRVQVEIWDRKQVGYNTKNPFDRQRDCFAAQNSGGDTGKVPQRIICGDKTAVPAAAAGWLVQISGGIIRKLQEVIGVRESAGLVNVGLQYILDR